MKERKRNRLFGFDYSRDEFYFVTFNVETGRDLSEMRSNQITGTGRDLSVRPPNQFLLSEIVNAVVHLTPMGMVVKEQLNWLEDHFEYVKLHASVIMPDHVHFVIQIDSTPKSEEKIKNLSELIGAFKTTSSKRIHLIGQTNFKWHRSFHDRVIRNQREYDNIIAYIQANPSRWNSKK